MLVCTKFTMSGRMGTVNTAGRVVPSWDAPSAEKTETTGRADMAGLGLGSRRMNLAEVPGKMAVEGNHDHRHHHENHEGEGFPDGVLLGGNASFVTAIISRLRPPLLDGRGNEKRVE